MHLPNETPMNYHQIAKLLDDAARNAKAIAQISTEQNFNLQEAYAIQSLSMMRRYRRGEVWVGLKLGFTSYAKMQQMGIKDIIWGRLTDSMQYNEGRFLHPNHFIHPRAEPEIAFRVSKDVNEAEVTLENAQQMVDGIAVAIEIIDSRYMDFKFSLEDVVADNCSSSGFSIGPWLEADTSIDDIEITLLIDDKVVESGTSNAILSNPWNAFVEACRMAKEYGEFIPVGAIILAGAATSAVYIDSAQKIEARAKGLGAAFIQVNNN